MKILLRSRWTWIAGAAVAAAFLAAIFGAPYLLGFWHKARNASISALYEEISPAFTAEQFEGQSGDLAYNLHVPDDYNPAQRYPLIVFIHDSSAVGDDPAYTLKQGYGALVWATPDVQRKQPLFVVAPQFDRVIANDKFELDQKARETIELIRALTKKYSIDPDRIYITGQSMGCMAALALAIEHPHFFAGILCVAGQWDPKLMAPLAHQNLLYIVSEGDAKASPGMDAFEQVAREHGAHPATAVWNGRWSEEKFAAAMHRLEVENGRPLLVKFERGSVLPWGVASTPMFEHIYTWDTVYQIAAVRDWLLRQRRQPEAGRKASR